MADKTGYRGAIDGVGVPIPEKFIDNGDGTYSAGPSEGTAAPAAGEYTNRSGTITVGGTAQTAAAANTSRKGYFLQNISAGDLWFSLIGAAVDAAGSVKLAPGASAWSAGGFVSTQAISIIGATTGQKFTLYEG